MFLTAKSKGFVFEQGEHVSTLARVSSFKAPLVIEELRDFTSGDETALTEAIATIGIKKAGNYLFAKCGISPEQGFIRRAVLDPKRFKEENYLSEVANNQFRIDPEANVIAVLNAQDGLDYDSSKEIIKVYK